MEFCFDKLHDRGYFRDPYNPWDLLRTFDLSWWVDITPLLDSEQRLSVANARKFLEILTQREATFKSSVASMPSNDKQYFQEQYRRLQRFLQEAIDLDQPIECSL